MFGKVFDKGRAASIAAAERIGGRVLDVGVGTGLSLSDYKRSTTHRRRRYFRADAAQGASRASKNSSSTMSRSMAVMDAKNLALADNSFDAVVAQYVITAVPDPEATLDDFVRVLKPGGELILVNHIGAESGPRQWFELGFAPIARRLGWRPEFPWQRLVNWAARHGGVALIERKPMPPLGHFSLIRYRKA